MQIEKMTKDERAILYAIENEILEVANCFNEVNTSDLQGLAMVSARRIYNLVRSEK